MRVLFVSAATPPAVGSHATRTTAFIEALTSQGAHVTVLTAQWPEEMKRCSSLYRRMQSCAEVVEVGGGLIRSAADVLRGGSALASAGRISRHMYQLRRHARRVARNLLLPDSFASWIPGAFHRGVRIAKGRCDVVISSGAPFSSHVVAALVSRVLKVPLVLDYGDPWVFEPGFPRSWIRRLVERRIENFALIQSKAISVTTGATKKLYEDKFEAILPECVVLPMGYDPSDFPSVDRVGLGSRGPINFVYGGRINDEYRSLSDVRAFIKATRQSGEAVLFDFYSDDKSRLLGELGDFIQDGLVRVMRPVDHVDYTRIVCEADCLIVLGNNNYIQVPGKIPHVVAARRPVVYFPNVPDREADPSLAMLREVMQVGLFEFDESMSVPEVLREISLGKVKLREDVFESMSWSSIAARFCSLVCRVADNR